MALASMHLLGPLRVGDSRCSHLSSSSSQVGNVSTSSLFLFHRSRELPSLHCQFPQLRGLITVVASVAEVNEEEPPARRETWRKQTPTPREKFKFSQRGSNQKQEFPWRSAQSEGRGSSNSNRKPQDRYNNKSSSSSPNSSSFSKDNAWDTRSVTPQQTSRPGSSYGGGQSRFNIDVPWDPKRRTHNSYRDDQSPSTSMREGDNGRRAGGSYAAKSQGSFKPRETSSSSSSAYSKRNLQSAPWQQRSARTGRSNVRDTKYRAPQNEVLDDEPKGVYEMDSNRGIRKESAMARVVEKLRGIQRSSSVPGQSLDFKRSRTLPRYGQPVPQRFEKRWSNGDASNDHWQYKGDEPLSWGDDGSDAEDGEELEERKKKVRPPSVAELTLPEDELKRLRGIGLMVRQRLKIGRLGVTPRIVEAIHSGWLTCEVVKVKCDGPPALNMRKTHTELELLTGGLVVWRSGTAAVVYRGKDYIPPSVHRKTEKEQAERHQQMSLGLQEGDESENRIEEDKVDCNADDSAERSAVEVPGTEKEVTAEVDPELHMMENILAGLGPRYAEWAGNRPVPVDGDLILTGDNSRFKRPFRLVPHGVKPQLSNEEMTELRRQARPMPPHFMLGKNKGLTGLAAAILKLWETSEIVKIGIKKGVQNTNNERMSEELKGLTGGVLLARDREYIVLYRGKDFLPKAVQEALKERDRMASALQVEEEKVRVSSRSKAIDLANGPPEPSKVGTLAETLEAEAIWDTLQNSEDRRAGRIAGRKAARAGAASKIEAKLNLAAQKKERAEKELSKLSALMSPLDEAIDKEHISEAERYMFQKLGLKMKAYLLIGRRGVFDGVVENMHLHWKHRELVKILIKGPLSEVEDTAQMLENESGGILIGIVRTSKGQAVIVYRGRNYQRPSELRPRHLLSKRAALKRSLEMQRKRSIEKHILNLEKEMQKMQSGLNKMEEGDEYIEGEDSSAEALAGTSYDLDEIEDFDDVEYELDADYNEAIDADNENALDKREMPGNRGLKLDPIFRAEPLSRTKRLVLRKQALKLTKTAHLNVGKSNVIAGLASAMRHYLQRHPLVKVGVKGRAEGTPVAEIVQQIEEATGAVLVSTEPSKLIFYRGWPAGEERPDMTTDKEEEEVSAEVRAAIVKEEEVRDPKDFSYLTKEECAFVGIEYTGNGEEGDNDDAEEEGTLQNVIDSWTEEEWSDEDIEAGDEEDEDEDDEDEFSNFLNAGFAESDDDDNEDEDEDDEPVNVSFKNSNGQAPLQTANSKPSIEEW